MTVDKMYNDLIKFVRCLEHLIDFGQNEYQGIYDAFSKILYRKTGLNITELYNLIEYITPDESLNDLEAVGFFNKFIKDTFNTLSESERDYYCKLIGPLIQNIWINRETTFTKIYSEGERLIKKYTEYEDPS